MTSATAVSAKPSAVIYLRVSTKEQAQRGGEAEGFSIPAQREACLRKADALGVTVESEFIDAGESARSAHRPELQRMLKYLAEHPVSAVIVHKVDRLARNRADDVEINLAIQKAGARLVSVTENIDETPSGILMHGIMSSIAEFYSRNLATESRKGMLQKAKNGGTPGMAPFGYRNTRQLTDEGREIRTVVVDPDRAEQVRWIYQAYASGEWTMAQLRDEMAERSVTTLPKPGRPARPIAISHIEVMLKNRYYLGLVKFEDVWYPGKHEALITEELWHRVQEVRAGRVQSREKPRQHPHYLKGSIYCGQCGEQLGIEVVHNARGNEYRYFYCMGRQHRKNGCTLVAMPVYLVEEMIEDHWQGVIVPEEQLAKVRHLVMAYLDRILPRRDREVADAERAVITLERQRDQLLQAHYAGAVPLDQLKSEQDRIAVELGAARDVLNTKRLRRDQLDAAIERALELLANAGHHYQRAPGAIRRQLNQSLFERFWLADDHVIAADMTHLFRRLLDPDLEQELLNEAPADLEVPKATTGEVPAPKAVDFLRAIERPRGQLPWQRKNQRPEGAGSNELLLVAGTGFEPATSGL
jgi:site-specific DNA recombinase